MALCPIVRLPKTVASKEVKEIAANGAFKRQGNRFEIPFGQGKDELPVEANRYRLLWSPVCPWAHRAVIVRELLGLQNVISLGTADPIRPKLDHIDWAFTLDEGNVDPVLGIHYIGEAYKNADPNYDDRPSVPAIVDLQTKKVVNNDYHRLTLYFEREWKQFHKEGAPDLYPKELEADILALNEVIFNDINNGVYKCGFARSQEAYEKSYDKVFERLDELEVRLSKQRYLHGNQLTDSDVRLYTTLARFDVAYYGKFLVNKKRLIDYPNLWAYARDLYQTPGFGNTTDFVGIKKHYFQSTHVSVDDSVALILPKGPDTSIWNLPHDRNTKFL